MDGLAQRIQEQVPPLEEWRKFIYCESMTGKAYGEVDHFAGGPLALGLRPLAQASAACCPAAAQHLSRPATGGRGCSPLRRATQGPRLSRRGAGREALPDATSSPSHPPPPAGQASAYQRHLSPEPIAHLSQHKLLPMLLDVAQRYPTARVLMGHRVNRWGAWGTGAWGWGWGGAQGRRARPAGRHALHRAHAWW
jgi:hypothetical protein